VKYGIDTRKQSVSTLSSIVDRMRKQLDKQLDTLSKDENTIRELEHKQVLLKEAIEKAENNKDYVENELSILKQDYESTIAGIKDQNDTIRVDVDKDIANRIQLVENIIDANYLKLMKNVVDKGCS
jgi:chromosome segregation ATPase